MFQNIYLCWLGKFFSNELAICHRVGQRMTPSEAHLRHDEITCWPCSQSSCVKQAWKHFRPNSSFLDRALTLCHLNSPMSLAQLPPGFGKTFSKASSYKSISSRSVSDVFLSTSSSMSNRTADFSASSGERERT